MLSEILSDSIHSTFFEFWDNIEPGTPIVEIIRQQIVDYSGLHQKTDQPGCCEDYDGVSFRDEVARHHAEMEAEKRKQSHEHLQEARLAEQQKEEHIGLALQPIAVLLVAASGDWLTVDEG